MDCESLYKQTSKMLIIQSLITLLIVSLSVGMVFNFIVVSQNGGKMPVKSIYNFETDEHFSFNLDEEVKHHRFADRYKIGRFIFSLGDFVMLFSFITLLIMGSIQIKQSIKLEKLKNG